jgi:hypothetical protein
MCHWVLEKDRRRETVDEHLPAKPDLIRPRLVGAAAVALIALLASAALLLPSSTPAVSNEPGAVVAAVAAPRMVEPSGPVIEQTAAALDDDVPSSQGPHDSAKTAGHCHHGL